MGIRGSLREASLPDVLQLLAMGLKTGCLSVTHQNNFGSIYFDRGRISFASIVNRPDRLGDILVKSGRLAQDQLDAAVAEQARRPDVRLGDIMVQQGVLTRDDLHQQIRVQIEEAVYFLFTWTQGTFSFDADVRPERQDFLVSINPDALLLEGARRVDEWGLIEKKIPTLDIVFEIDRRRLDDSDVELTVEQRSVVHLIDGRRDVQQIAEDAGLVEFEVGKALYGLATAGYLHRVGTSRSAEPRVPESRVEEHRNLGVAFYRTGMLDEALREFRRVVDLRPGDEAARFYIGLALARQAKWTDAANAFHEAAAPRTAGASVFHNLAYVLEQLGRYDDARAALHEAEARGLKDDPRVLTSFGCLALWTGDALVADEHLTEARRRFGEETPTAAWYHAAGLAAALCGDPDRAQSVLADGVSEYSDSATLHNNLSVVEERRNRPAESLAAADRGLHEDPGLAQLHRNAGDGHYRAGRFDEALEHYERAIKLLAQAGIGGDTWLRIGNIRLKQGERDKAIAAWERAIAIDPANAIARSNLDAMRRMT